eukprot:CAMPEP_0206037074 /NCGR_PEP_ID=MMETSP1466-20131121/3211_1 /ASSEMBLY_ACC=CAM_ASM_001126 /TAXON_ID=44452 /ORGANISM="Pavlova gyrans, Strain CCMP608" /LENGTH=69 /DNA_ID=CAMNT_0053411607 /DNA_START=24 /DNA_END=229 /DNA_ORIENTATION=+
MEVGRAAMSTPPRHPRRASPAPFGDEGPAPRPGLAEGGASPVLTDPNTCPCPRSSPRCARTRAPRRTAR